MLLSAILLAATTKPALIDFEVRATSLSNALGKLSRVSGITYKVDQRMAGEIICVQASQVSPEDLAAKIAEATECEWREADGAKILFRTAEKDQALNVAETLAVEKSLTKVFKPKREEFTKSLTPYEQAKGFVAAIKTLEDKIAEKPKGIGLDGPRLAAPSSLLVLRLAMDIGDKTLAALSAGQTVTFSNHPTSAQRPFGPNGEAYIKDFQTTEQQLRTLLPDDRPRGIAAGLLDDIYESVALGDSLGKVLMTVSRRGRIISFGVSVYTPSGRIKCWGFNDTYNLGDDYYTREQTAGAGQAARWIELSPPSKLFAEFADDQPDISRLEHPDPKPWSNMPTTAQKLFQNPEELDPLSFAATDGCFALADEKKMPIVAYLSDSQERAGRMATKDDKLNLARFEALLKETGLQQKQSTGWLIMKPGHPNSSRFFRISRPALGRFMRASVAARAVDLLTYGRFHFEAGKPIIYSSIARLYRKTLTDNGILGLGDAESHGYDSLALIGSLGPTVWQNLLRGTVYRLGQGTAGQRLAAEGLMKELAAAEVITTPEVSDLMKGWTEFSPRGLPAGTTVRLESKSVVAIRNFVKIQQPDGSVNEGFMDFGRGNTPEQIASAYAKGGYYKSLEHALTDMRKAKYQVFERSEITLWVDLLSTHSLKETFLGAPINPKIVSYNDWPQRAKEEFESTFRRDFKSPSAGGGSANLVSQRLGIARSQ